MQARQAVKNIDKSTEAKQRNNTLRLGKLMADAIKADKAGKKEEAKRIRAEFDKEMAAISKKFAADMQSGNMKNAVSPPTMQSLKDAVMAELYPNMNFDKVGKLKRQAAIDAYRTIMVEEDPNDLIPDEEPEDEGSTAAAPEEIE